MKVLELRDLMFGVLPWDSCTASTKWKEAHRGYLAALQKREKNEAIPNKLGLQKVDGIQNTQTLH